MVTTVEETTAEERHVVAGVVGLSIPTPAFGDHANRYLPVAVRLFSDTRAGLRGADGLWDGLRLGIIPAA